MSRPASRGADGARRPVEGVLLAITFLTIIPVRLRRAPALGAAAPWFPAVGAALGAVAGAVGYLATPRLGSTVAAILAVGALVVLTGALHQDGLADSADGLGARGGGAERRLTVMRDAAIGTFGALALILWVLLVVSALAGLSREDAFVALVVAASAGRWAALLHTIGMAPARPDGLGAAFAVSGGALACASVTAAVVALACAGVGAGLAALAAAALAAAVVSLWARRALGGRTGDTLGATVALAEVAVVLVLLGLA